MLVGGPRWATVRLVGPMILRFAQRLAVSSCAGAALFGVTIGAGLIAREFGFVEKRRGKMEAGAREPTLEEILTMACGAGAFYGAGYGLVRPILPRQPELAGLIYALAEGVAVRAQLNAFFKLLKREQRFPLTPSRLAGEVILGLSLARAERVFGPRPTA
jgi:hypothetical protein